MPTVCGTPGTSNWGCGVSTIHFNSNSLIWSDGRRQIAVNALTPDEWDCLRSIQNIAGGIYPYAMARRLESDDFIYYLKDTRSGLTKVGRSVNPKARLKEVKRTKHNKTPEEWLGGGL